jgi:hydroxypyruvate isomerase
MPDFAARLGPDLNDDHLLDRLAALALRGFDAVEISAVTPALATGLRTHGLAAVVLDAPSTDLIADPRRQAEFRASISAALASARIVGCWHVSCAVGAVPAGVTRDTAIRTVIQSLGEAARLALPLGLRILVEPIRASGGPAVLERIAEAVALLDLCRARNASLLLNVAELPARDEPVTTLLTRHLPRIGHIRLASDAAGDELINFIDGIGYRGWIGCAEDALLDRFPPKSARGLVWGMPKEALRLTA